jgi:hypothetical protein
LSDCGVPDAVQRSSRCTAAPGPGARWTPDQQRTARALRCIRGTLLTFGNDDDQVNPVVKIANPRATGRKQRFARHRDETIHEAIHEVLKSFFAPLRQIS